MTIKLLICFSSIFATLVICATANQHLFSLGKQMSYQLSNDVFIRDFKGGKPIAYRLTGAVNVATIFADDESKLLKFTLESPELHVRPHGSLSQTEFKYHRSPLDTYENSEFYGIWSQGNISQIFINAAEQTAMVNLKKGIVGLFQCKTSEGNCIEEDASGVCDITYGYTSHTSVRKTKRNCSSSKKIVPFERFEQPLRVAVQNHRSTEYTFLPDGNIDTIESRDYFFVALEANRNIGSSIDSFMALRAEDTISDVKPITSKNAKEYLLTLKKYKSETLQSEPLADAVPSKTNLKQAVKRNIDNLNVENVGTLSAANAFIELLPLVREANKADLVNILRSTSLIERKGQLLDLWGAAQTVDTHESVKVAIDLSGDEDIDNIERYLQALAISTRPNEAVIRDLLKLAGSISIHAKVKLTLINALGSMAYRFAHAPSQSYSSNVVENVESHLIESLLGCKDSACYESYLNGLRNLQSTETIDKLIAFIEHTDRSVAVAATKALKAFPSTTWNAQQIWAFENIFHQTNRRYDSSTRTIILDILLKTNLKFDQVKRLLAHLKSDDKAFEVKKYLLEQITLLATENKEFGGIVQQIIQSDSTLNNYHIAGQKGLSTALARKYSVQSPFNGTLTSIQEIFGGVLKRGTVDLTIDTPSNKYSVFTLGLYAGGMSSFVSSNTDTNEAEADDENANAGMEITVQQSYLRPLEFFNGQGELMGHVWSGTASEPTPAFTATTLLHDHHESIQLQNGATVSIDVLSALSIDLNGAVQLSLWNRNAQSVVNKNTGHSISGEILVNAGFVTLDSKFSVTNEPKLNLRTDIDFSSENILCMQLSQPNDILYHKIEKNQIIPEVRHHVKAINNYKYQINGFTHFLNQKNNDMCNRILTI